MQMSRDCRNVIELRMKEKKSLTVKIYIYSVIISKYVMKLHDLKKNNFREKKSEESYQPYYIFMHDSKVDHESTLLY